MPIQILIDIPRTKFKAGDILNIPTSKTFIMPREAYVVLDGAQLGCNKDPNYEFIVSNGCSGDSLRYLFFKYRYAGSSDESNRVWKEISPLEMLALAGDDKNVYQNTEQSSRGKTSLGTST